MGSGKSCNAGIGEDDAEGPLGEFGARLRAPISFFLFGGGGEGVTQLGLAWGKPSFNWLKLLYTLLVAHLGQSAFGWL